jgi:lysozyme
MSSLDLVQLLDDLKRDEGFVAYAYQDTLGYWTIGYGFLIDKARGGGIPKEIAELWLLHEVAGKVSELAERWPHYQKQPDSVMLALANMAYQLGVSGLMRFKKMLTALETGDRERAAVEALDSTWAKQTPNRAQRVAALIRG